MSKHRCQSPVAVGSLLTPVAARLAL